MDNNELATTVAVIMSGTDLKSVRKKEWKYHHDFQVAKSKVLEDLNTGRVNSEKAKKLLANERELKKLFQDPCFNFRSYPRSVITDADKLKWLLEEYNQKRITADIFVELASVLRSR